MAARTAIRLLRRCSAAAATLTLALPGCTDRPRPSPLDPALGLTVEIVSPFDGASVLPTFFNVSVHGHDAVGRLDGLAVLVRRAPEGTFVDSEAVHFQPTDDKTATLRVQIPNLNKTYGLNLFGIALNATGGVTRTTARALAALACPASGCPDTASVGQSTSALRTIPVRAAALRLR